MDELEQKIRKDMEKEGKFMMRLFIIILIIALIYIAHWYI